MIWGIIFVIRGLRIQAEEKNIIPFSEHQDIKDLKNDPIPTHNLTEKEPSLTEHLLKENLSKTHSIIDKKQDHKKESTEEMIFFIVFMILLVFNILFFQFGALWHQTIIFNIVDKN